MRRRRTLLSVGVALVVLVAIVAGAVAIAGGGDDETTTAAPTTTSAQPRDRSGAPSSVFPPQFIQCLKDRGVEVEGLDPQELLHGGAVPAEVLNTCFSMLHEGDDPP
jgi:hypothetical protein